MFQLPTHLVANSMVFCILLCRRYMDVNYIGRFLPRLTIQHCINSINGISILGKKSTTQASIPFQRKPTIILQQLSVISQQPSIKFTSVHYTSLHSLLCTPPQSTTVHHTLPHSPPCTPQQSTMHSTTVNNALHLSLPCTPPQSTIYSTKVHYALHHSLPCTASQSTMHSTTVHYAIHNIQHAIYLSSPCISSQSTTYFTAHHIIHHCPPHNARSPVLLFITRDSSLFGCLLSSYLAAPEMSPLPLKAFEL